LKDLISLASQQLASITDYDTNHNPPDVTL